MWYKLEVYTWEWTEKRYIVKTNEKHDRLGYFLLKKKWSFSCTIWTVFNPCTSLLAIFFPQLFYPMFVFDVHLFTSCHSKWCYYSLAFHLQLFSLSHLCACVCVHTCLHFLCTSLPFFNMSIWPGVMEVHKTPPQFLSNSMYLFLECYLLCSVLLFFFMFLDSYFLSFASVILMRWWACF